jgi:hypothetical protein
MKKFIITGAALVALAAPATAMAAPSDSGATHGTFGYLGAHGERPNLGQGDNMGDLYLGASPQTGLSNASVVGNGTPTVHDPVRRCARQAD